MKKAWIIILVIVVIVGAFFVTTYNGLVQSDESVKSSYSAIDVQLKRRNDLIPNLVETVKGYAAHETEAIQNVSDARARLAGAKTTEDTAAADAELTSAISRLLMVVENYPDLKANENFIQLSDELAGTENRISTARKDYNDAAQSFNRKIRSFPTNIIGGMMGFEQAAYFEASEADKATPQVKF